MELPVYARGVISLWFVLLLLFSCVAVFRLFSQKNYLLAIPAVCIPAVSYVGVQYCVHVNKCHEYGFTSPRLPSLFGGMSFIWLILLGLLLTALAAWLFLYSERWRKIHVNAASLKEGMDDLPSGLCWYFEDGTVALRNRVMERLCYAVTDHELYDGALLEAELRRRMDGNNVMTLPDGTAWSINLNTVEKDGAALREICANDITEEYKTTLLLTDKQREARLANEKLTAYSRELAQMITAGEILAAKVRIHDELGQGLLLTRKYLLRGGTAEDKEKLLYVLRRNSLLLESSRGESGRSYLDMILEAASDMGVRLVIDGRMPEKRSVSDVITTAIHENLTNTIRHAQGDEMRVELVNERGLLTAVFTNNGMTPSAPVEERGGLAMLRSLVEAAGGEMTIEHTPEYKMTLRFEIEE